MAEGVTDQTVIENILLGYFEDQETEPAIQFIQPPRALAGTVAGWGQVFQSLKRKDHEAALQFNDFLVIQIDTDVQEEPGFDVPRRENGVELSIPDRVARVIARFRTDMDTAFYQANTHRLLFAVAVETIECWLLPLLYGDKKKAAKTTGCLEAANRALRKANGKALSAGDSKHPVAYDQASRAYTKRKLLMEHRDKNPSLELFILQLDDLQNRLTANHLAASQAQVPPAQPPDERRAP